MSQIIHVLEILVVLLYGLIFYRIHGLMSVSSQRAATIEPTKQPSESTEEMTNSAEESVNETKKRANDLKAQMRFANKEHIDTHETAVQAGIFVDAQIKLISLAQTPGTSDSRYTSATIEHFLIGAIDYIGRQSGYGAQDRYILIKETLEEKFNQGDHAKEFDEERFDKAYLTTNIHITRAGAKAAKMWLKMPEHYDAFSITSFLNEWQAA